MHKNKTVLVIEHDQDNSEIIAYILSEAGYDVEIAVDANDVNVLLETKPDLILLDEWLGSNYPGPLCRYLKSLARFTNVPVILSSTDSRLEEIAIICEADAILKKPFDLNTFLDLVAVQLLNFRFT